jgi:hypothetical protein
VGSPLTASSVDASQIAARITSTTGAGISLDDPNPQKWDQLLVGMWYVPGPNLLAYLVTGEGATPIPIADQTIFQIASAENGVFSGQNSVELSLITPYGDLQPGVSNYTMSGVVTPAGQIRIQFTPTSSTGMPVTGVGNMVFEEGAWRMTMQMSTGTSGFVMHWAYMTKPTPGEMPPPARLPTPLGLRSWQWSWLQSTRWGITDSEVFDSSGGVFQIDGYRSGYFWGTGTGSTSFSVDGSVTPEGNLSLVLTTAGASPVMRTGILQSGPDGRWHMVFRAYDSEAAVGAATLLQLLSPSQLFVSHLYEDLLHRQPDPVGLASWSIQIEHGLSRSLTALLIQQSLEARIDQVQHLYQALLKRPADAGGLTAWVSFLDHGATSGQLHSLILGSAEYYQVHGHQTPGAYVTALYEDLFQRQPDAAGAAFWTQALAQGLDRSALVSFLRNSPEGAAHRTVRLYADILDRSPDPVGAALLAQTLSAGMSDEMAIAYLAGSTEYFSR